jgi:hypothetical protein
MRKTIAFDVTDRDDGAPAIEPNFAERCCQCQCPAVYSIAIQFYEGMFCGSPELIRCRERVYATHFIVSSCAFSRSREDKGQLTSGREVQFHPPTP